MHKITRRIPVKITKNSYEIVIGRGSLQLIGEELLKLGIREGIKILIVTNKDVAEPYSEILLKSLKEKEIEKVYLYAVAGVIAFYKRQGWQLEPKGSNCGFWYAN